MRRILSLLIVFLLVTLIAVPAFATSISNLVLCMREDDDTPVPGAVFDIYQVGIQDQNGELILNEEFENYPIDVNAVGQDTSPQAMALFAFAKYDKLEPLGTITTTSTGYTSLESLAPGLYLIGGYPLEHDGYIYHTEPQLLSLPQKDASTGEILTDPILKIKFSKEHDDQETVSRKVLKIWEDDKRSERPKSIRVHLLKNGKVYDTVTLTAAKQWRHVWKDLSPEALWQIVEEVPDGYIVHVEQEGTTFLVTNVGPEIPDPPETDPTNPDSTKPTTPGSTKPTTPGSTKPTTPSGGTIDQTGMILWPVILLGGTGLLFIVVGVVLRKEFDL